MKNFLPWLFVIFLFGLLFAMGIGLAFWIGESDLPFWVKLWLLSK